MQQLFNMNIGILTFYRVANFGANLQALSTYMNLKKNGFTTYFIQYYDKGNYEKLTEASKTNVQYKTHLDFIDKNIEQSKVCFTIEDINDEIERLDIKYIIVGSDAVIQHHPLLSRIYRGKRKPLYISKVTRDRLFPNPFWGVGISKKVGLCMMSASSQNSQYHFLSKRMRTRMKEALNRFTYLSVRDTWTLNMLEEGIGIANVHLTPDPVFAFNENCFSFIPSKQQILAKYQIPEKYILISLHKQVISKEQLAAPKQAFEKENMKCVVLPMPNGVNFIHPFDYEIKVPLTPIDWYGLIKYSSGYIGSNMHPIVVALHNAVPCYSIDNWGTRSFWGKAQQNGSSKVLDILKMFNIESNRQVIENSKCIINVNAIIDAIKNFPQSSISEKAKMLQHQYSIMMNSIYTSFNKMTHV